MTSGNSKSQFKLATLFLWITACSVFLGSLQWIFRSRTLGSPIDDFSFVYVVGFPLMGFGLIVAPAICAISFFGLLGLQLKNFPSTISSWMFIGYSIIALIEVTMSLGWLDSANRMLAMLIVVSIACFIETTARKLPRSHLLTATLNTVFTFAYYLYVAAAAACCAV